MRVRVTKGGWTWHGIDRHVGDLLTAPSEAWVANRVADGLVEPIAELVSAEPETAMIAAPETAMTSTPRPGAKKRGHG